MSLQKCFSLYRSSLLILITILVGGGWGNGSKTDFGQLAEAQEQAPFLLDSKDAPEAFSTTSFYTSEEMLSAVPYDWQPLGEAPDGEIVTSAYSEFIIGEPGYDAGSLPLGQDSPASDTSMSDENGKFFTTGTGYPGPFTRYENFEPYTVFPYCAIGKLFFKPYGSPGLASCTAASIGTYAIWTAGHCVSDGAGHWHSGWVFVPAYRSGSAPLGQWAGSYAIAPAAWHNSSSNSRDSAGVILKSLNGKSISQQVGALGFAWNQAPERVHWFAFGYPSNIANAHRQIICAAGLIEIDGQMPAPRPVGMGCDMTNGSSGGPWIMDFGNKNYLNGNVNYGYPNIKPLEFFSPYFDNQSKSLKDALVAATP